MGGHGALTIALRNQDRYASVSAFADLLADELPVGREGAEWISRQQQRSNNPAQSLDERTQFVRIASNPP
jgi:S-formylglutathione hydrolase FrmB